MKTAIRRTSESKTPAHADLDGLLKRKLQDPEFRAAYDAEDRRAEHLLQVRLNKPAPQKNKTRVEVRKAIATSKVKFDLTWDELRNLTREA